MATGVGQATTESVVLCFVYPGLGLFHDFDHALAICWPMIRVVDLHKSFGRQAVLKGINLELETGKITTIIGGSGSGKTVLLKHLNALLLPDRGSVLVDGKDITKLGERELNEMRQKFGVLFQGAALLDSMTFRQRRFPLREKTECRRANRKRVKERLAQVGLAAWATNIRPKSAAV